jgi:proliferating cell nuclear antigen
MRLKTIQASAIKSVFEVLKDIITDVNIIFDKDGVTLKTLDMAKVTFVNMHLGANNFEMYECPSRILAGVNIANMFKLLKIIGNNDTLEMSITPAHDIIEMLIENTQKRSKTLYKMKLLDINEEEYNLNDMTFDVTTNVSSMYFQRIVRDMLNFSSQVVITRDKMKILFECDGDFVGQVTEIESTESKTNTFSHTYSLKYINMFAKATNICSNVNIQQSVDGPILFNYFIANLGHIEFYLAPVSD